MKFRKERRRFNYFVAFGLILAVIAAVIFIIKYYQLQAKYYRLLEKQPLGISFEGTR